MADQLHAHMPLELHPDTANLVVRFAAALAEKLRKAEIKYGYRNFWMKPDWMDECRAKLIEHLAKGDPRDVAAYCAFLWHHGDSTAAPQPPAQPQEQVEADRRDAARYRLVRRGQHWSVVNGIGDTLRAEELDTAVDAVRAAQKGV